MARLLWFGLVLLICLPVAVLAAGVRVPWLDAGPDAARPAAVPGRGPGAGVPAHQHQRPDLGAGRGRPGPGATGPCRGSRWTTPGRSPTAQHRGAGGGPQGGRARRQPAGPVVQADGRTRRPTTGSGPRPARPAAAGRGRRRVERPGRRTRPRAGPAGLEPAGATGRCLFVTTATADKTTPASRPGRRADGRPEPDRRVRRPVVPVLLHQPADGRGRAGVRLADPGPAPGPAGRRRHARVLSVVWKDDPYSTDLHERFGDALRGRAQARNLGRSNVQRRRDGRAEPGRGPRRRVVRAYCRDRPAGRVVLVLPAVTNPARRFLRALLAGDPALASPAGGRDRRRHPGERPGTGTPSSPGRRRPCRSRWCCSATTTRSGGTPNRPRGGPPRPGTPAGPAERDRGRAALRRPGPARRPGVLRDRRFGHQSPDALAARLKAAVTPPLFDAERRAPGGDRASTSACCGRPPPAATLEVYRRAGPAGWDAVRVVDLPPPGGGPGMTPPPVWKYAEGLAPVVLVWLVLVGWLAALLVGRANWADQADAGDRPGVAGRDPELPQDAARTGQGVRPDSGPTTRGPGPPSPAGPSTSATRSPNTCAGWPSRRGRT